MGQWISRYARRELARKGFTTTKQHVIATMPDGTTRVYDPAQVSVKHWTVEVIEKVDGINHSLRTTTYSIQANGDLVANGWGRIEEIVVPWTTRWQIAWTQLRCKDNLVLPLSIPIVGWLVLLSCFTQCLELKAKVK